MSMSAAKLAVVTAGTPPVVTGGIEAMVATLTLSDGVDRFVAAWTAYFADATPAYTAVPAAAAAMKNAMLGALTGPSTATLAIQQGVIAFWTVLTTAFATAFSGSIAVTPPAGIATLKTALDPIFTTNTAGKLSLHDAASNVAAAIHTANALGTVTFPPAVVTVIT